MQVDADNILGTNQWIPSILILIFEIITVILLMNLMVSKFNYFTSEFDATAQFFFELSHIVFFVLIVRPRLSLVDYVFSLSRPLPLQLSHGSLYLHNSHSLYSLSSLSLSDFRFSRIFFWCFILFTHLIRSENPEQLK